MTPAPAVRRHWPLALLVSGCALALLWGALAPLRGGSHERLLELSGGAVVPPALRLTLGVQDVLLLRNASSAPLVFGPVQLAPGGEFRLPFEEAGEQLIPCPLLPGGALRVRVVPAPDPGWDRLRWRLASLGEAIRTMPLKGPDR